MSYLDDRRDTPFDLDEDEGYERDDPKHSMFAELRLERADADRKRLKEEGPAGDER